MIIFGDPKFYFKEFVSRSINADVREARELQRAPPSADRSFRLRIRSRPCMFGYVARMGLGP
jgi:hypothetical protein